MKSETTQNPNQRTADRWMVVDDNADILMMMHEWLSGLRGAEVECYDSPLAALSALRAAPDEFELIVTDFEMPDMDGIELGRQMRAHSPALKTFLATGSGAFTEAAARRVGFNGLLAKPFLPETLCAILTNAGVNLETANMTA